MTQQEAIALVQMWILAAKWFLIGYLSAILPVYALFALAAMAYPKERDSRGRVKPEWTDGPFGGLPAIQPERSIRHGSPENCFPERADRH